MRPDIRWIVRALFSIRDAISLYIIPPLGGKVCPEFRARFCTPGDGLPEISGIKNDFGMASSASWLMIPAPFPTLFFVTKNFFILFLLSLQQQTDFKQL